MSNTPRKPGSWWLKIVVIFAAIVGAYFIYVEIQTRLGEQARESTGLTYRSLDEALVIAQAENKPVLAELSAVWCPTCRALDAKVFAVPEVRSAIERYYVFAQVEYESEAGPAFMEKYGVSGFPTLLILRPDGTLKRPLEVTMDPVEFLKQLVP